MKYLTVTSDPERTSDGNFPSWQFGPGSDVGVRSRARRINSASATGGGVWHAATSAKRHRNARLRELDRIPSAVLNAEPMNQAQWRGGAW